MNRTKINILAYLSVTYEKNWYRDLFKALVESDPDVMVFAIERPLTLMGALLSLGRKAMRPAEKDTSIKNFKPLSIVHERIAYVIRPLAWLNRIVIEWQVRRVLKAYGDLNKINVSWIFHPYQLPYIDYLNPKVTIYHVYDDYHCQSRDLGAILKLESSILSRVDILYLISKLLLSRYSPVHNNIRLMSNGVSEKFLKKTCHDHIPSQLLKSKKPRICSWGYISERLDFDLILNLARMNPRWSFVFIGECARSSQMKWKGILKICPNINHIEEIDWDNLPAYLNAMDIMFIPHIINDFNAASSPVRLIEALMTGKPLITPNLPYGDDYKNVIYFAETPEQYSAVINRIIKHGEDPAFADQRVQYAKEQSWENKAKLIKEDIINCLFRKAERSMAGNG